MRVLIWATHLQTDILSLSLHLDACDDVALMVVTPDPATYLNEPIAQARPIGAPVLDRAGHDTIAKAEAFGADVVVADNHLPPPGIAPRLFYMWHGLGWKARNWLDRQVFYHMVRRLTGADPRGPNPAFRAQCYGPSDRNWRIDNWKLPASSCAEIGMTFSDMLLAPPYAKEDIAHTFKVDVINRKTVVLAISWHYGGIFANADSNRRFLRGLIAEQPIKSADLAFLRQVIATVRAADANLVICFNDRRRYDTRFLAAIEALTAPEPFIEMRFKDEHPDNLADLMVADVMISNLSSILAYYYVLGRPTIHIMPAGPDAHHIERRTMLLSRFNFPLRLRADTAWMLPPTDVGGVIAHDPVEATAALEQALADPHMGARPAREWLARHVTGIDGQTGARFKRALEELCAGEVLKASA